MILYIDLSAERLPIMNITIRFSRRDSISHSALETQSNAYATINKLPMAGSSRRSLFNGSLDITDHNESRDYATLEKSYR